MDVPEEEFAVHGYTLTDHEAGEGNRAVREWKQLLAFPSNEGIQLIYQYSGSSFGSKLNSTQPNSHFLSLDGLREVFGYCMGD